MPWSSNIRSVKSVIFQQNECILVHSKCTLAASPRKASFHLLFLAKYRGYIYFFCGYNITQAWQQWSREIRGRRQHVPTKVLSSRVHFSPRSYFIPFSPFSLQDGSLLASPFLKGFLAGYIVAKLRSSAVLGFVFGTCTGIYAAQSYAVPNVEKTIRDYVSSLRKGPD